MSELAEELAEGLAKDLIAYVDETGDEDAVSQITTVLGDRSQTLQEAFITAIRVIRAERRGREVFEDRKKNGPPQSSY